MLWCVFVHICLWCMHVSLYVQTNKSRVVDVSQFSLNYSFKFMKHIVGRFVTRYICGQAHTCMVSIFRMYACASVCVHVCVYVFPKQLYGKGDLGVHQKSFHEDFQSWVEFQSFHEEKKEGMISTTQNMSINLEKLCESTVWTSV